MFPNRHYDFQPFDNFPTGIIGRFPVPGRYPEKQRSFADWDKPDAVMENDFAQPVPGSSRLRDQHHLALSHRYKSLVFEAINCPIIFESANNAKKIDDRAEIARKRWRHDLKWVRCDQDVRGKHTNSFHVQRSTFNRGSAYCVSARRRVAYRGGGVLRLVERYTISDQLERSSRSICANLGEAWRKPIYVAAFIAKTRPSPFRPLRGARPWRTELLRL